MRLKDLEVLKQVTRRRVDQGMVGSRLSTRAIEGMGKGVYDKLMRSAFSSGRLSNGED